MRDTSSLLQVRFASQTPFPAPDEREDITKEVYTDVLNDHEVFPDYHTLSTGDLRLVWHLLFAEHD